MGHLPLDDALCQTFRNSGLAHTGLPDEHRIVFRPTGQDLDDPLDLLVPTDHRIHFILCGHFIEIPAILIQQRRCRGAGPLPGTMRHVFRGRLLLGPAQHLHYRIPYNVQIGT